jgi:nitroreductase
MVEGGVGMVATHGEAPQWAAVEAAITGRRSVKEFEPRPVPREVIARLLDVAIWAPNHRLTEPWRFYVLDGASRERLGETARQVTLASLGATPGADPAVVARKADEAAATWASVPALLYVTVLPDADPELDLENYGAACIAVQNMMLAAHAAGLATSWSSGAVAASEGLRALAGAGPEERLVGLIRLGYPRTTATPRQGRRAPGQTRTVWVDDK